MNIQVLLALIATNTLAVSASELSPIHHPQPTASTGNQFERRLILLLVAVLSVFLFWVLLTAYLLRDAGDQRL